MNTLADELPQQQARCREIQSHAREIGSPGAFLVAMLEVSLRAAERAAASGDVVEMLRATQDLRSYQE